MKVAMISSYPPERCGLATYADGYVKELRKSIQVETIPVPLETPNPFVYVKAALRSRKADLVHVQYEPSLYGRLQIPGFGASGIYTPLLYLLLAGKPVVSTMHEISKPTGGIREIYNTILYRFVARSKILILHTVESAERLKHYLPPHHVSKIRIIPHSVFPSGPCINPADAKKTMGVAGKTVLLIFGYPVESKGHIYAIEALNGLPEECRKNLVLMIAGSARNQREVTYLNELRVHAKRLGMSENVIFTDYIQDDLVPTVFAAADIVLLPYTEVVQSGILLQAIAYGKPVIASDLPGFREVADLAGNTIRLVPPKNSDLLREQIKETLANQEAVNTEEYLQTHGVAATSQALIRLYKELLERKAIRS